MIAAISKVGKLHKAGRKGLQRWRVKYWLADDAESKTKYLGPAEGDRRLTAREASRLLSRWVQEVGANPDIAHKVTIPTLQEHIHHYLEMISPRYSPNTLNSVKLSIRYLVAFFGGSRRLNTITPTHGDNWLRALTTGKIGRYLARSEGRPNRCRVDRLADGTVKPHINNARHLFAAAMKRFPGTLRTNPFAHIKIKVQPKKGTWRYVPYSDTIAALEACTDIKTSRLGWQVFIALCRFAGLRKSEALNLEKMDVELEKSPPLIKVYASKTSRATGTPSRIVPVLFPILERLLVQAIAESPPSEHWVVSGRLPRTRGSDQKTLMRILDRADVPRWKPAFQVLRACFEKDLLDLGLPEADYTKAVGHSPEVSRKFYLAKFEGADLDTQSADRFIAAAERLREKLSV